ncbi:hypothetical protein KO489_06290 [Reinekea forsetii]|nr:hypothetical protein [Reinekea forsetii]
MSRILLAGLGDLNSRVAALAQKQGHEVIALRRTVDTQNQTVQQVGIDLSQERWPDYQIDYLVVALSAQTRSLEGYQKAYLAPLEQLSHSLSFWKKRPKKIIVVSSSRVFGESHGEYLYDDSLAQSVDPYANILLAMERQLHAIETNTCAATLSGIYSAQRDWLKRQARKPRDELPVTNHWTNRIHINDAAAALMHLIALEQALPERVLITDKQPMPMYEVLDYLRQEAGLPKVDNVPEVSGGKQLVPKFLESVGFAWQFPTAKSGGYSCN